MNLRTLIILIIIPLSAAAFADDPAPPPQGASCGNTANDISFNIGKKGYAIGRDVKNNGGGWYFDAGAGEILVPNKDGQLCEQTGTLPDAEGAVARDNNAGSQKCGSAIDSTRKVSLDNPGTSPDVKEYQWQWHKTSSDPQSQDKSGYLTITPLDDKGNNLTPVIRVNPSFTAASGDQKKHTGISVELQKTGGTGPSEKWSMDFGSDQGKTPAGPDDHECSLGLLMDSTKKQLTFDDKKGVVDGANNNQTVAEDFSPIGN